MSALPLSARAEAFLFMEGGTLSLQRLSKLLNVEPETLTSALDELERTLVGRSIGLVRTDREVSLILTADASDEVRKAQANEMSKEIGDAGLEVLSILLYHGPCTRSRIDYVRGVNTSSTIRNLLTRGLIERVGNPDDAREYVYRPTVELLAHLGVRQAQELPDYATISHELKSFEEQGPFGSHASPTDHTVYANGPSDGLESTPQ